MDERSRSRTAASDAAMSRAGARADGTAVMFGAGNVGRGFLGQLFSESGQEVVFVDVDPELVHALDQHREYTIHLVTNENDVRVNIAPVRALLASDIEAVSQALANASIAATAVGARALPQIAPLVAAGITRRAENSSSPPLNIIICENLKGAAETFRGLVSQHVAEPACDYFTQSVGFVDTVIGRMVPPPTPEMRAQDPRLIAVEPYKELPVDRQAFIGPVPLIVGIQPSDNFPAYTARKLYIHNCGHAFLAYLGYLRNYTYGYEALEDPYIRTLFEQAMAESEAGIAGTYGVELDWLKNHRADLMRRFANRALGDTIFRLARDPMRKLAPSDRLVGAARLAEEAGIIPTGLCLGIAAAYCFDHPDDPIARELQQRLEKDGLDRVLVEVSEIHPEEPLAGLVRGHYQQLSKGKTL
jgi:mannitol-1-phosphate 5-dehydrogenase